jgi:CDC45-like protein
VTQVKAIVLLNCGARTDLTSQWFMAEDAGVVTLLLDSHRPIHHKNVHADDRLIIVDEEVNFKDCPTQEDIDEIENDDDSEQLESEHYFGEDDEKENQAFGEDIIDEEDEEDIQKHIGKKRALKAVNLRKERQRIKEERRSRASLRVQGREVLQRQLLRRVHLGHRLQPEQAAESGQRVIPVVLDRRDD